MDRINTSTKATDLFGTGKHGFVDTDAATADTGTHLSPAWCNGAQEELVRLIEGTGITPSSTHYEQLHTAILAKKTRLALVPTRAETAAVGDGLTAGKRASRIGRSRLGSVFLAGTTIAANHVGTTGQGTTEVVRITQPDFAGVAINVGINAVAYDSSTTVVAGVSGGIYSSTDEASWTLRTPAASFAGTFHGGAYGASTFVLVGTSGTIQTSAAGTTWAAQTAAGGYTGTFYDVIWSPVLNSFVAVGGGGAIQTSTNGTSWTARTAAGGFAGDFTRVVEFALAGKIVAMGAGGVIQTSTDGITWTSVTNGTTSGLDLCVMGNALALLDDTGGTSRSLWVSSDAVTWAQVALPSRSAGLEYRRMGVTREGQWMFATQDFDRVIFTAGML